MQTQKALSVIYAAPSTYDEIHNFIYKAKQELLNGDYNPLDVEIQLKAMEEIIKQLRADDEIRQAVIDEAEKYGKSFDYRGCKISVREGGVKYDYNNCNDTTWSLLDAEDKAIAEAKKAREKYLQNLPPEGAITPDGEAICRPAKTSKTTIAVTLK
jgi:hypothetical protein